MAKAILIIKIGSSVITDANGDLRLPVVEKVVDEIAALTKDYRVVLVSSGAVSSGKRFVKNYDRKLAQRKAAAAIGNPLLINEYSRYFSRYGVQVAQALLERHHFSNRPQFLQLRETLTELWQSEILTIVNENDVVSNYELKFSDNDELATLLAVSLNAEALVFCTTAGGFKNDRNEIIHLIHNIDDVLRFLTTDTSQHGTGGMASKLTFTKLATTLGIRVIYCGVEEKDSFRNALESHSGSTFSPKSSTLNERQKWIASGSITMGSLQIDEGAFQALSNRKSLLLVGVVGIERGFRAGEIVQLSAPEKGIIGVAKMKHDAADLQTKRRDVMVAHADDIVLF
jgi:glutamate 5-kinase